MSTSAHLWDRIARTGIVPVATVDAAEDAVALADALKAGGIDALEITFRTDAASDAIAAIAKARPDISVGAGTLLDTDAVDRAAAAGAQFGLAPGFDSVVLHHAKAAGLPFVPGIATPTEIQAAIAAGARIVKLFPAAALGGLPYLESLAAPFAHLGVRFLPTGGVGQETVAAWLSHPAVIAVGGSWMVPRRAVARRDWATITKLARAAVTAVAERQAAA